MQQANNIDECGKITWGELKRIIEKSGIKDSDEIDRLDIAWGNIEDINVSYDDDYGWQIYL